MKAGELGICLNENVASSRFSTILKQQPEGFILIAERSVSSRSESALTQRS